MSPLNKLLIKPLTTMFVIFMSLLVIFGLGITKNTHELQTAVHDACLARSVNDQNTNRLLDQLIVGARNSTAFTEVEKADRIAGWAAVRHEAERCIR